MATKINIGGELDPRTVEGIVADAKTIIDRTANKRQDTINSEVAESLSGKQDNISDLETIRSGATAGATAVQPTDIEDVVHYNPSGEIAPLVDPSDYATTEDLNQLTTLYVQKLIGSTSSRPSASTAGVGATYFDTDLGKMIVSNGTTWVNMDGTALA